MIWLPGSGSPFLSRYPPRCATARTAPPSRSGGFRPYYNAQSRRKASWAPLNISCGSQSGTWRPNSVMAKMRQAKTAIAAAAFRRCGTEPGTRESQQTSRSIRLPFARLRASGSCWTESMHWSAVASLLEPPAYRQFSDCSSAFRLPLKSIHPSREAGGIRDLRPVSPACNRTDRPPGSTMAGTQRQTSDSECFFGNGGAKGGRTPDLLNAIQALSQLSYGPIVPFCGRRVNNSMPRRSQAKVQT